MSAISRKPPVAITREELFRQVWETPMSRLAIDYGISGNGLAKICDRLKVPYPPRGYWAKKAAGQKVVKYRLPPAGPDTPAQATITPTVPAPKPPELAPEVKAKVDNARSETASVAVAERLMRPHRIIAGWLDEHDRKQREARRERDPDRRRWMDPGEIDDSQRRQHRILDALFKALEKQGGAVRQGGRRELLAEMNGEEIEFSIREKQKQGRRPLTESEQQWASKGDKGWRQELVGTGLLVFTIKTYLPDGLKREWLESDKASMESLLPDIVATFVSAGPLLIQRRKQREDKARQRQIAEQKRYQEQQRRKRDDNRWRKFVQLAQQRHDADLAHTFLEAIRATDMQPETEIDGRNVREWILWAEDRLTQLDPLNQGVENILKTLAGITEWSQ